MSKHTPGPWEYQEQSDAYTHIVRGPDNLFICQLAQTTSSEIEANARLIAAAPELLEALNGYMSAVDQMNLAMDDGINVHGAISAITGWAEMASAAIAKATGK